ncbi:MAG: MFS transporter [Candidatus Hodarchaeota archaeon]
MSEISDQTSSTPDLASLRSYWFFLSGQLASLLGSSVVQFAIVWWITLTAKDDPALADNVGLILGIASFLGFAPMVVTFIFAGVFVDRWNRKVLIGAVDGLQALVSALLVYLFLIGEATILYIFIVLFVRSVAQGFHRPALDAIIPLLIPREKLTKVNSVEYLANGLIFIVGPIVGAIVVEVVGLDNMGLIISIDVFTFVMAIIPLVLITIPDITLSKRTSTEKTSFKHDFMEGIGFLKTNSGLLSLLVTFTICNFVLTPIFVLSPLIVYDYLKGGNAYILALSLAFFQFGATVSSLILTQKTLFTDNVKGVVYSQTIVYFCLFLLALSVITGNIYLFLFVALLRGICLPIMNVHSQNIWQTVVPPELQGRVMSMRKIIAWGLNPVSMLLSGYLADAIGPTAIFLIGGFAGIFFLAYAWIETDLSIVEEHLGLKESPLEPDKAPSST